MNPEGATPYATISMYDDLVATKGLGLIRGDLTPNITKKVQPMMQSYELHRSV